MRRAKRKCEIIGERRFGSVFSLYLQDKGLNPKAVKYSAVKIEKFSTALDHLERVSEIRLGDRTLFRAILHDNKIYVLGGMLNNHYVQSVSATKILDLFDRKNSKISFLLSIHCCVGLFFRFEHL